MVQSVERAFVLLDRLATGDLGLTELAREARLPKSTVARLLKTLEEVGAVERSPDSTRYRIGAAIANLAGGADPGSHLQARARPLLAMLAHDLDEDAGLSVPNGYMVHYIDQVDSDNAVLVRDWTGEVVPMHLVPSGLVMLAHWPQERVERYLARPLAAPTPHSMTDPALLRKRFAEIRRAGHAWVFEEFAEGINSVAAPAVDRRGRAVAAVHVHGPAYRFPGGSRAHITNHVTEAARQLSEQLQT